ncbi:MAG: carbonic anhydrase [Vicinamibacteraceae bacterium]
MRRMTLGFLAAGAFLQAVPVGASTGPAPAVSPAQALQRLKDGNERFVSDVTADLRIDATRRAELLAGQAPYALVLSCADSRVPPELVFNTGLGDLFVVRSAGEVLDRSIVASLEYGAEHLKSPLLVVMGHEFCGAVKAAKDRKPGAASMGPNLDFLLKQIQPAVARADKAIFDEPLRAAVLANVELVVAELQVKSPILHTLVERGRLQIVGAFYELSTGRVSFSNVVAGRSGPALTRRESAGPPAAFPPANVVTARPPAQATIAPPH